QPPTTRRPPRPARVGTSSSTARMPSASSRPSSRPTTAARATMTASGCRRFVIPTPPAGKWRSTRTTTRTRGPRPTTGSPRRATMTSAARIPAVPSSAASTRPARCRCSAPRICFPGRVPPVKTRIAALFGTGALLGGLWACFDGIGTIGSICFADNQCGVDQRCINSVCGLCNDRQIQPGELCFASSSAENVFGEVSDLLAFDPEGDGFPLLAAVVNNNCAMPPLQGPPTMGGPSCWGLYILTIADDGDFETQTPLGTNQDGRVPQMAVGNFDGNGEFDVAIAISPNDPLI